MGSDPDGDRVVARDRRGNQQLIPRTYLRLLPSEVRSLVTSSASDPPEQRCLRPGPAPLLAFHQSRGRKPQPEAEPCEAKPINSPPHNGDPEQVAAGGGAAEGGRGEEPGRPAAGLQPPGPPGPGEPRRYRQHMETRVHAEDAGVGVDQDKDPGGDAPPPPPLQQLPGV